MEAVGYVAKNGENKFHGYSYATEADLTAAVRPELAKRSLMMIPTVLSHSRTETVNQKGNKSYFTQVEVEWSVVNGETGEERKFLMPGTAEDPSDKGLYKAITGSEKYALKNLFLVPTGDDPEKDDEGNGASGHDYRMQPQPQRHNHSPPSPAPVPAPEPLSQRSSGNGEGSESVVEGKLGDLQRSESDLSLAWVSIGESKVWTRDASLIASLMDLKGASVKAVTRSKRAGSFQLLSFEALLP
jgi:hypothetical protein